LVLGERQNANGGHDVDLESEHNVGAIPGPTGERTTMGWEGNLLSITDGAGTLAP
jgi:hypothetical protein